jgi:Flp pilus assembly protein TadB
VVLTGMAAWYALKPQTRFQFGNVRETTWKSILIAITEAVEKQTAEPIRHAADALGWPSSRIAVITGAVSVLLFLFLLMISWWVALLAIIPIIFVSWRLAGVMVMRQYREWQQQMVRGLPSLIAVLRVHLDLGRTVQDSLNAVLPGMRDPLRRDLLRTLSDMATAPSSRGEHGEVLTARDGLRLLADRVNRLEFRTFTDTITQAWGSRLSGAAIEPLQDLLRITRERETEEQTSRLDMVMTTAPGLALFGIMILVIAGWLLGSGTLNTL